MAKLSSVLSLAVLVAFVPTLASAQIEEPSGRWSANLRPTLSTSSNIGSSTKRLYGSINIVPSPSGAARTWQIEIHLTSDQNNEQLLWTVAPGKCVSGAVPLAQPNEMAPLEVRSNGIADVTTTVKFQLNSNESYHIDVFRNGQQQEHVIACAPLKYSKPK